MNDRECVIFLQWALPKLHLRWKGFRRVRRQVCRRIKRRLDDLNIKDTEGYRDYLNRAPDEWTTLDRLCRITISKFYRDRAVWECLAGRLLPELANTLQNDDNPNIRIWSAGCASGEEPYTVALLWYILLQPCFPGLNIAITATDVNHLILRRAEEACYPESSVRNLPSVWRDMAFEKNSGLYFLKRQFKSSVHFKQYDIRDGAPEGKFDMVFCRNLAFTYFDLEAQDKVVQTIRNALHSRGFLITGIHEFIQNCTERGFTQYEKHLPVYRKEGG